MPTPEVKEDFPVCTGAGRLLGGQRGRGSHPIISVDMHPLWGPQGFHCGVNLSKKLCPHLGQGPS